jgi:hypothetical protein
VPHSAQTTTPLTRAVAMATAATFVIRPSHARARLDVNGGVVDQRQRVLCGALDARGRHTCGDDVAFVLASSASRRELLMGPGWISAGTVWHPTKNLRWRRSHGYASRYRRSSRVKDLEDGIDALEQLRVRAVLLDQYCRFVTQLPAVAICCEGHINILDADRLNVETGGDERRLYALSADPDEDNRLLMPYDQKE